MSVSSVNSGLHNYVYSYKGGMRLKVDKDDDSMWSRQELENYAESFYKATGYKLDLDKIFELYDKDGDGYFNVKEQEAIYKDDALGLNELTAEDIALFTKTKVAEKEESTSSKPTSSDSWEGILESMNASKKYSLTNAMFQSEQKLFLLNAMMGGGTTSSLDLTSLLGAQQAVKLYNVQASATRSSQGYNYYAPKEYDAKSYNYSTATTDSSVDTSKYNYKDILNKTT